MKTFDEWYCETYPDYKNLGDLHYYEHRNTWNAARNEKENSCEYKSQSIGNNKKWMDSYDEL